MLPADASFGATLLTSFEVIGRLFLVALIGFILVRAKVLKDEGLNSLTRLIIDAIVPCALGVAMIKGFNRESMALVWPLILMPPIFIPLTVIFSKFYFRFWRGGHAPTDRAICALAAIPNSFYVPFPVALAMTPPEMHVQVGILLGAAVLAVNPLQWTLGTFLVVGEHAGKQTWTSSLKHTLNGPVLGVVGGVILSFVPGFPAAAKGAPDAFMPLRMVLQAMDLVGKAMAPLAMIVIGALIAKCEFRRAISVRLLLPVVFFRFLAVPGIIYFLIQGDLLPVSGLAAFVLMLEASAPSAMNLAVVARRYGGDWDIISGVQLIINLIALVTLPLWMTLGLRL